MTKKKIYEVSEKQINKFARDTNAIINLKKISNQEFFNDITSIKSVNRQKPKNNKKYFFDKYNSLFDDSIAYYGKRNYEKFKNNEITETEYINRAVDSYLGSLRRNANPNYINKSKSNLVKDFNKELRKNTIIRKEKLTEIPDDYVDYKNTLKEKFNYSNKSRYKTRFIFYGFCRKCVEKLKNIKDFKRFNESGIQEVQLRLNFDLLDDYGNILQKNCWYTAHSNGSIRPLVELFDIAFENLLEWQLLMEQSGLEIREIQGFTYVYRQLKYKR